MIIWRFLITSLRAPRAKQSLIEGTTHKDVFHSIRDCFVANAPRNDVYIWLYVSLNIRNLLFKNSTDDPKSHSLLYLLQCFVLGEHGGALPY